MISEAKGFYSCPTANRFTTSSASKQEPEPKLPNIFAVAAVNRSLHATVGSILKYFYLPDVSERRRIDPRG